MDISCIYDWTAGLWTVIIAFLKPGIAGTVNCFYKVLCELYPLIYLFTSVNEYSIRLMMNII